MSAEMVAQVRRFNRTVTQRIGVLNENFLASDRSLGQLLWELTFLPTAQAGGFQPALGGLEQ
jgi:hypothetical protein